MSKRKKSKLKIAMLGHKRVPSREGGIEVVVEELSTRMIQQGHQVTCYNRKGHHISGSEFDSLVTDEYKGIRLKSVFTINCRGLAAMTSSVVAAIRAAFGRYDIVHFHAEGSCVMLWFPKLLGKRCVVTIHGLDHQRAKWGGFARAYIMLGEKCAVRFADEIIVLSQDMQNYFWNTYHRETHFIPNGASRPVKRAAEVMTEQWGLEKEGYILFLGRIVPEKGLIYLIKAFQQVRTNRKLVIAGGTSDSDAYGNEIRKLAREDNRILFTGFVQGQMLEELYSNAYLYVLPSDLEGMPLTLLEAMSYGNCCLVSDIPECSQVVEDKAVTFPRGNIQALRESLQKLCDSPETVKQYRQGASAFILGKYNWDDVTAATLRLYGKTDQL